MALIKRLEQVTMDRNYVHSPVSATYTVFVGEDGEKYLQVDTYGSSQRQIPGKKSQSVQFDPSSIEDLKRIIEEISG